MAHIGAVCACLCVCVYNTILQASIEFQKRAVWVCAHDINRISEASSILRSVAAGTCHVICT